MTIKKEGLIKIAFHLCENDWTEIIILYDFARYSLDAEIEDPVLDVLSCLLEKPIGCPFFIKVSGKVRDTDVLLQGWESRAGEILFNEFDTFLRIQFRL